MTKNPNSSSSKISSEMKVVGLKADKLGMGRLRAVKFQSNQSQGGVLRHLWSSLHSMDRNSFTKLNNLRRKRFAFGGEHLNATSEWKVFVIIIFLYVSKYKRNWVIP